MAALLKVDAVMRAMEMDSLGGDDQLLEEIIDGAQKAAEREMGGRSLAEATSRTEYHTPLTINGHGCIFVNHPPIVSVTSLYDDYRFSARLISSANYIRSIDDNSFNWNMGKVELWNDEGQFVHDRNNVAITYTGGWTASTLPGDLRQAWIDLVRYWYENPDRVGIQSFGDGSYRVNWEGGHVPEDLRAIFNAYAMRVMS